MHEMLTILTDVRGVCLSRSLSRLHCAKMAKQIKMLFGVNTPGGPWSIVLNVGGHDPLYREGKGPLLNFWTLLISPERLKLETCSLVCM